MSKYWAIPVRDNGRDQCGTSGCINGQYQSVQNFIRYNRQYFESGTLYSVYLRYNNGEWKFQGFHSDLPFQDHHDRAMAALEAEKR